jgi:hypothetical protein
MPEPKQKHQFYRVLLRLYPKAHRVEYGEQMVQTLEDILADRTGTLDRVAVWLRVTSELPVNIVEEHIHNIQGVDMGRITNKRIIWVLSGVAVVAVAIVVSLAQRQSPTYSPTTLANVRKSSSTTSCLQPHNNTALKVDSQDSTFIGNNVASSIIDVAAGTNVDVFFKTYTSTRATGTAVYGGKYGSYNYVAQKVADNKTNNYVGGWKITSLVPCK